MACSGSKFARSRRIATAAALTLLLVCVVTAPRAARAAGCGAALLDGLSDRLRALEAPRPVTQDDALRRSRDLSAMLNDPPTPCASDAPQEQLRDLARARVLVLWGKMLALQAVDAAVFPAPYPRRCAAYDGANLQTSFIQAWTARLDPAGADATPATLRQALDDDPLFRHVSDLALERAQRLRIVALPASGADETAWLQANETLRARAAAQLSPGLHCGPIAGLWGI